MSEALASADQLLLEIPDHQPELIAVSQDNALLVTEAVTEQVVSTATEVLEVKDPHQEVVEPSSEVTVVEVGLQGPVGRLPRHEWSGTRLRWELPDGSFAPYVDLGLIGGGTEWLVPLTGTTCRFPNPSEFTSPAVRVTDQGGAEVSVATFLDLTRDEIVIESNLPLDGFTARVF